MIKHSEQHHIVTKQKQSHVRNMQASARVWFQRRMLWKRSVYWFCFSSWLWDMEQNWLLIILRLWGGKHESYKGDSYLCSYHLDLLFICSEPHGYNAVHSRLLSPLAMVTASMWSMSGYVRLRTLSSSDTTMMLTKSLIESTGSKHGQLVKPPMVRLVSWQTSTGGQPITISHQSAIELSASITRKTRTSASREPRPSSRPPRCSSRRDRIHPPWYHSSLPILMAISMAVMHWQVVWNVSPNTISAGIESKSGGSSYQRRLVSSYHLLRSAHAWVLPSPE